jgi:hypothetical protein
MKIIHGTEDMPAFPAAYHPPGDIQMPRFDLKNSAAFRTEGIHDCEFNPSSDYR